MPMGAMPPGERAPAGPAARSCGTRRRSRSAGIWQASHGKPCASIVQVDAPGSLWPVKPTKRTLPCSLGLQRAPRRRRPGEDAAPGRRAKTTSWICQRSRWSVCRRRSDSLQLAHRGPRRRGRGVQTLVIRKTWWRRRPRAPAHALLAAAVVVVPGVVEERARPRRSRCAPVGWPPRPTRVRPDASRRGRCSTRVVPSGRTGAWEFPEESCPCQGRLGHCIHRLLDRPLRLVEICYRSRLSQPSSATLKERSVTISRRQFVSASSLSVAAIGLSRLPGFAQTPAPRRHRPSPSSRTSGAASATSRATAGRSDTWSNADGAIAIDSQFMPTAEICVAGLKQRAPKGIELLINTHHHGDHTSGNRRLPARREAHPRSRELRRRGSARSPRRPRRIRAAPGAAAPTPPVVADSTFKDTWSVDFGNENVHVRYFGPGHTSGDAVIFFEQANVVHAGDLLFRRLHPRVDGPAGASVVNWTAILEKLMAAHGNDTAFVFGHGKDGIVLGKKADVTFFRDYLSAALDHVAHRHQGRTVEGRDRQGVVAQGFRRCGAGQPADHPRGRARIGVRRAGEEVAAIIRSWPNRCASPFSDVASSPASIAGTCGRLRGEIVCALRQPRPGEGRRVLPAVSAASPATRTTRPPSTIRASTRWSSPCRRAFTSS